MTRQSGQSDRMPFVLVTAGFWSAFDRFAMTAVLVAIAAGFHVRLSAAVAVASAYFLAYGCLQPVWGVLSDRFGRVRVLRFALAGALVGGVVSTAAPSLTVLLVARALSGACYGGVNPTSVTYVGDLVPADAVKRALSPFYAAGGLGVAAGIALGGVIVSAAGWRYVFAVPAVAASVLVVAVRRLPEPDRSPPGRPLAQMALVARSRQAMLVVLCGFLAGAVVLGCVTFLPALLQHHGASASVAGLISAVFGLAGLVWSLVYGRLARRVPRWGLTTIGGVLAIAALLVAATGGRLSTVVVAAALLGGGWMFTNSSLASRAATVLPKVRGTMVSLYVTGMFVGGGVAPALATDLADRGAYSVIFLIGAGVAVLVTLLAGLSDLPQRNHGEAGRPGGRRPVSERR